MPNMDACICYIAILWSLDPWRISPSKPIRITWRIPLTPLRSSTRGAPRVTKENMVWSAIVALAEPKLIRHPALLTLEGINSELFQIGKELVGPDPNHSGLHDVKSRRLTAGTLFCPLKAADRVMPAVGSRTMTRESHRLTLRANKSETIDMLKFTLEGAGERSDGNARTSAQAFRLLV